MRTKFKGLVGIMACLVSATAFPGIATAQEEPEAVIVVEEEFIDEIIPVAEAFEEAFFDESGNFFSNSTAVEQADTILGIGLPATFPEMEIEQDAENIHELYEYFLTLQTSSDPVLRTPDLPNPYQTSVLLLPVSPFGARAAGPELRFERIPLR